MNNILELSDMKHTSELIIDEVRSNLGIYNEKLNREIENKKGYNKKTYKDVFNLIR